MMEDIVLGRLEPPLICAIRLSNGMESVNLGMEYNLAPMRSSYGIGLGLTTSNFDMENWIA